MAGSRFGWVRESAVQRACRDFLYLRGYRPIREQSGLLLAPDSLCENCRANARRIRIGEPGMPDYSVPKFMVEVKRPGGKLSAEQKERHLELGVHGVDVAVVDSPEALLAWLAAYERKWMPEK